MDYLDNYIKYKTEYMELKNANANEDTINILEVDHVMFPVYNNNIFLDEVANEYSKNKDYVYFMGEQTQSYKGIYLHGKHFYIEHLSTVRGEYYWSNSLGIILDKKYWSYYKNPDLIDENFMRPKFGCGYFFINPHHEFINKKISKSEYDNFTIYISRKLKGELENLAGMTWKLPTYIQTSDKLCQSYDIIVKDNDKYIGPLFQSNVQEL